ncbi:hypothetical protein [Falsigemmobacter faecalis]|uniref:Uncharacterized protein n=1 Tax=Falsigemmobacter faecalis TaxID=2488730 RepID=A0A3P3DLM4_9RHOB|nr:hypothetical protein [Falsigemmobacter faecalis]RRH75083.1 hypothetical protein EG244_08855 [Falsigemmobacter faecalis]
MTLSLTHPLTGLTAASAAALEAAQDSMSYWQSPKTQKPRRAAAAAEPAKTEALDQMFAYFG